MAVKKKSSPAKIANVPKSIPQDKVMPRPAPMVESPSEAEKQLQAFDRAMQLFRKQDFQQAKEAFEKVASGPQKEIAHNSRLHIIMCERRLQKPALALETLDDHYNYAIERLNARDVELARKHLDCALHMVRKDGDGSRDHLFYALALCAGLAGDADGAFQNLKQAIDLNPKIRMTARQDSDLALVAQQPKIQQLLYPEKQAGPF